MQHPHRFRINGYRCGVFWLNVMSHVPDLPERLIEGVCEAAALDAVLGD